MMPPNALPHSPGDVDIGSKYEKTLSNSFAVFLCSLVSCPACWISWQGRHFDGPPTGRDTNSGALVNTRPRSWITSGGSPLVDLGALPCPTKIVGADLTLPFAYLPTIDLSDIISVNYDFLPETTHCLQFEAPKECVAIIREFLEENGLLWNRQGEKQPFPLLSLT